MRKNRIDTYKYQGDQTRVRDPCDLIYTVAAEDFQNRLIDYV